MYVNQPDKIRSYTEQIFPRIRQWIDAPTSKISEEAYRHTDTRVLTDPPSKKMILVAITFVFVCLSVLVVYYGLYAAAVKKLEVHLNTIMKSAEGK